MGKGVIAWLDSLCPRLKYLLERQFRKEFRYDFRLATEAVENSVRMWRAGDGGHFYPDSYISAAEICAFNTVDGDDERTLNDFVNSWLNSPFGHRQALERNNVLGIGFAYCPWTDRLYATVRLRAA
jgi:uncharacterized protein YkwD